MAPKSEGPTSCFSKEKSIAPNTKMGFTDDRVCYMDQGREAGRANRGNATRLQPVHNHLQRTTTTITKPKKEKVNQLGFKPSLGQHRRTNYMNSAQILHITHWIRQDAQTRHYSRQQAVRRITCFSLHNTFAISYYSGPPKGSVDRKTAHTPVGGVDQATIKHSVQ